MHAHRPSGRASWRRERIEDCRVEAKIRREKQPKKKFELVTQLQELQGQIGQMSR